ncbi:Por secretion system C-terminal sorting domain-containing protein, partial [Algoriphagus alkaliphilus]
YNTQGTHTVTWKFDDGNGNTSQQTQTVIVKDITAPVPSLAQLPIIMGECSATVSAPTAIDSCQGIITGTTADPISYGVQGTYTINWIFDDGNGNTATQEQTVIVEDIIAPIPTLSTLPTITTETSVVVFGSLASDNCEGAIIGTTSDPTSYSEQGTYTITWVYRDSKGNTSTQNQTVIVNAATIPVWNTLPGSLDRTLYCSQDHLLAQAQLLAPAPSDPDRVVSLVKTSGGFVMPGPNGAGTLTNTWIATDLNGIQSQVFTQVITFQGIEIDASASSIPVQVGTSATLSATVLPAVSGVKVTFLLDGNQVGFANTDVTGKATISVSGLSLDVYKVTAVVGSGCSESIAYLPVYDPNGNFVTGGGWINSPEGALVGTTTVGKANFGFVSKYKKGSNQVDGNTEFQFNAGSLSFKSILHEAGTLVISGKKATYRGEGSINGVSGFKFTLVAIDGQWNGGTNPDQFRIKIWGSNGVIYDNGLGAADNSEVATVLGGGSIVIHESKAKGNKRVSTELITVAWSTPFETIKKKLETQSSTWFEGRKLALTLDARTYDPLTPGLYELKADLVDNEFFELDEPIAIQVLVQDKPIALDIELSNQKVVKNAGSGTVIGTLNTIDPVDDIHTYSMDPNPDLEIRGNQLIWKGINTPAAQMKFTVFSTDRAGQTISKDIVLTREVGPNQFILYPNPAQNETNIMVDLDEGAEVEIQVFDAVGRMVIEDTIYRGSTFIQTLDLNGLAPGMYMVQVKIGYIIMTERLIKR